ncbi:hypothetical protein SCJ90_20355, partial [Haloferax volcanii]|nr:hypothetical protein [Haloferax volcanii]
VLYHLRTKFDLETLEQIGNTLLQKDVLDVLPQQVEVCADLHLLGKDVENVFLEERVPDLFERLEVELGAEMVEN